MIASKFLGVVGQRMVPIDLPRFQSIAVERQHEFRDAAPFPHIVIDDFLDAEVARSVVAEFHLPTLDWGHYYHVNERKLAVEDRNQMGPATRAVFDSLQSDAFILGLRRLTSITTLIADPDLDGGGVQQMLPGGFVNVHSDFLSHARQTRWSRQINLLLYLNPTWDESYRGWLELWDASVQRCVRRIAPTFNRCVIFRTSEASFHGVPADVACPEGESRKSIASYYFCDEGHPCGLRPTNYVPLPGDPPMKRMLIGMDRRLLHLYTFLKRYTPLGNRLATKMIKVLLGTQRPKIKG